MAYQILLDEINGRLIRLAFSSYSSKDGVSLEEITAIVSLGHDVIAGAREYREKKVQAITGLLKELKLERLSDLIDNGKEDKG